MGRIEGLGRFAIAITCMVMLVCTLAPAALADTAGNAIASGGATTNKDLGIVGGNLYWAGRTLDLGSENIGGDVIAAGQEIDVNSATIGANIRTASENVFITGATVHGDITSAGRNLKVGEGTTCAGAYLAGATIEFAGDAKALYASAQTVTISGTIDGDAHVNAGSVLVTDDAVITGTLTVSSGNPPQVASGAKVGKLEFQQTESDNTIKPAMPAFSVGGLIYFAIVFAVIAIIMAWAFRRAVDGAGQMVRTRPAPMLVTGLVAIIAAIPVILVLLLVAPLAGSVICAYGMVFFVAAPFAGASIARLVFPQWNRFGSAAAGGAVAGVLVTIPVVRALFVFAAFMYLLGYVLQCIYLDMKGGLGNGPASEAVPAYAVPAPASDRSAAPVPPAGSVPTPPAPETTTVANV